VVSAVRSWSDALLAAQAHAGALTRAFVLYERAAVPLAPALAEAVEVGAPLAFAAGPEGGLSAAEVDAARAAGFQEAGLGPRILRTETVPAAVLGAVLVARQLRPRATG
jgi:16S rRNA (uracil1498-N3)-methyltransferase